VERRAGSFLDELQAGLIGDKAYDADRLGEQLRRNYDIELIAPNRESRSAPLSLGVERMRRVGEQILEVNSPRFLRNRGTATLHSDAA
jgi:hypothetical protein